MSLWVPATGGSSIGFICRGRPALLPFVDTAPRVPETAFDSAITVDSEGMVFLNSKWYPAEEFPSMIQQVARVSRPHAGSRVVLKVDRVVPFGTIRNLLRGLREIGINEATLLVESRNPYAARPGA